MVAIKTRIPSQLENFVAFSLLLRQPDEYEFCDIEAGGGHGTVIPQLGFCDS